MGFELGPRAAAAGYRLAAFEAIGSTSAEAMQRAGSGDSGRLWVVATEQTAGHGRRGRTWMTPPGNLAASLLLRGPARQSHAATLGFVAGLALEEAIRDVRLNPLPLRERVPLSLAKGAGEGLWQSASTRPLTRPSAYAEGDPLPQGERGKAAPVQLKWPNDVLINGAKVAGILLEAANFGGATAVVVGIGVNVRHAPRDLPYPASSLAECGLDISPEALFQALTEAWVEQETIWNEGLGFAAIRQLWLARAAGLGAPIAVRAEGSVVRGIFETIDDEGRLIVRLPSGGARSITAGEVHFGAAATAEA